MNTNNIMFRWCFPGEFSIAHTQYLWCTYIRSAFPNIKIYFSLPDPPVHCTVVSSLSIRE